MAYQAAVKILFFYVATQEQISGASETLKMMTNGGSSESESKVSKGIREAKKNLSTLK